MELILASAVGAVICYIYTNSNAEDNENVHKSKSTTSRTTKNTIASKHSSKNSVSPAPTKEKERVENGIMPKPSIYVNEKPVTRKPDYSMQLIDNMLDQMLVDENH